MKSLSQVRQAYEDNYQMIIGVIQEMGGNENIKEHRREQSRLYRRLKDLQRREHQLDALETQMVNKQFYMH